MQCMQGQVDEKYCSFQKNLIPSQAVRISHDHSMSLKVQSGVESGTCNVCSAPCSSCMHRSMAKIESKREECFDENSHVTSTNHSSIDEGKASNSSQPTLSESSNLVSPSHGSLFKNVESKAIMKPYNVSDASEDHGTQRTISYKREGYKGAELHDDSISSVSRASDPNAAGNYCEKISLSNSMHCNSASAGSFGSEESIRVPYLAKEADIGTNMPNIQSQQLHPRDSKLSPLNMPEISAKVHLKPEPETENSNEDLPGKAFKCSADDEEDKMKVFGDLPHKVVEPPLKVAVEDESEESDVVEHDVKVCDICGDAGREDLLAICSKCSDGAEHTYCMREMLQKVPEGDWLCEECKLAEDIERQRQGSDAEGKEKTSNGSIMQILGKRNAENLDAASAPKRLAVETNVKSPKLSSPRSIAGLSRESSFKSLEKGKMWPSSQNSSGNHSSNDGSGTLRSPAAGQRPQVSKNMLSKCNSFSALSLKPKVKLVEDVPQKQKSVGEHDSRAETTRMMGKSKSFKSSSFGRLNVAEPKVKVLPSKGSHVQDLKSIKQVRESTSFERKNLTKLDRSNSTVSRLKADQKLTPLAEMTSPTASNVRELKAMHLDGKRSNLSRSDSCVARKGIENAATSVGASPTIGVRDSFVEQKSNEVYVKDEPSVSSSSTERLPNSLDGVPQDVSPQLLDDKTREKQNSCPSKALPCQKGKEHGHTAEHVSGSTSEASASDVSAPRNAIEDENKGFKVKAAIEAAARLKPGICSRASQDQLLVTSKCNVEAPLEGNLQGQTTDNNMSLISDKSTDTVPSMPDTCSSGMRYSSYASSSVPAVFRISAIPEHDYIWMGDFELHSIGKPPIICGGMQAHLSTLASAKVFEVVNKFGRNIVLSEVPRLRTWPMQFHHGGPKDDNIALYFFAKDLESYEKNYNGLLERLIRNDLALKACFDGVELLVFPSNQLPENSQRWNTLFFLWGVFRGSRKMSSGSPKDTCTPSSTALSLDKVPESTSSSKHLVDESAGNSMIKDEDCGSKVSCVDQNSTLINLNSEIEECETDACGEGLSSMPTSSKPLNLEMKHSDLPMDQHDEHKHHLAEELGSTIKDERGPHTREGVSSHKNLPVRDTEADALGRFSVKVDLDQVKVHSLMVNTVLENQDNLKEKIDDCELNNLKRPFLDLSQEEQPVSTYDSQEVTWSEVTSAFAEGKHAAKKLKPGFGAICGSYSSRGEYDISYSSPIEKRCVEACEEKIIPEDLGSGKGCMFPVGSQAGRDLRWSENSMQWKDPLLKDGIQCSNDVIPNLELGLGAETRSPKKETWPFVLGTTDKDKQSKPSTEKREDDISASLSLSLSFPSAPMNSEETVKAIPKPEQLVPDQHHLNTPFLLFGSFPDK